MLDSIENEESILLQRRVAMGRARLLELCLAREKCPNVKITATLAQYVEPLTSYPPGVRPRHGRDSLSCVCVCVCVKRKKKKPCLSLHRQVSHGGS